jgi:transglutaminase-like putative cysteine protease
VPKVLNSEWQAGTTVLPLPMGLLIRAPASQVGMSTEVPPDPYPMDFSAWFEIYLGDRWYTLDARKPRVGRILMAR